MLEKLRLAHLPTPVDDLSRLSERLEGIRLLVKRDDQTGLAFGGNKTRKLELLLADARSSGAELVLTTGAAQSNHCRQTAAAAAAAGMDCLLVLVGEEPRSRSGNLFLDQLLGAEIVWTDLEKRDEHLEEEFFRAEKEGRKPYLIPYGGSNALGAAAYYLAFEELLDQFGEKMPQWIIFASSSGGTQAGLAAGAALLSPQTKILGISVDEPAPILKSRVASLAEEAAGFVGRGHRFQPEDILVRDEFLGKGYGVMGNLEREAICFFARQAGLLLDPVYTGRAAGGLLSLIQSGFFAPNDSVLFWHTGGTPGLFADRYLNHLME